MNLAEMYKEIDEQREMYNLKVPATTLQRGTRQYKWLSQHMKHEMMLYLR